MSEGQDSTLNNGQPAVTPSENGQGSQPQTPAAEPQAQPTGAEGQPNQDASTQPPTGYVPQRSYNRTKEALRKTRAELARARQSSYSQNAANNGQGGQPNNGNDDYVANLELKVAENDLKSGARKILKEYPQLPAAVRRAILNNPRGFVNPTTTDVETGLMDIEDYLEEVAQHFEESNGAESQTPQVPNHKQVKIAGTNSQSNAQGSTTPAEIARIMAKPVDEWTAEDHAKLGNSGAPKL